MHITRFVGFSLFAGILAMCVGCTRTVKVAYNPGVVEPPIHAYPISLSLSKEFCEFQHTSPAVFMVRDTTYKVEFGPHLRTYAIHVAKSVFGDVEVLDGGSARTSSKLLLEPKALSSDLRPRLNVFVPNAGALCVQWVFRDARSGQTLLTIPVQCEYMHRPPYGQSITAGLSSVTAGLMTKLTDKTLYRFRESKDLQELINP